YPEGSGYANIGAGCFPFRETEIAADIASHIERHHAAGPGSPYHPTTIYEHTKRVFSERQVSREKNMERLLKMAAFSALVWRAPRTNTGAKAVQVRPRSVWITPPIDRVMFEREHVREKVERYESGLLPAPSWDDRDYNNAAAINMHLALLYRDRRGRTRRLRAYALLDQGLTRFPKSLLLRFNAAHWRVFEGTKPNSDADRRFQDLIDEFDGLFLSPTDSDVALPMTLHQRDQVFPYYEYNQLVLSGEVTRNSGIGGDGIDRSRRPAQALLAAAHGYLGLLAERRDAPGMALERYRQSLAIFPDNVPLMRTRLRLLCRLARAPGWDRQLGDEIVGAFSECAERYPTILLSELYQVVPALDRADRQDAIRDLLAMWYRLGSVTTSGSPTWYDDAIDGFLAVALFEHLYPEELRRRLQLLRSRPSERVAASQFETLVHAATELGALASIRRKMARPLRRLARPFAQVHAHFRTLGLSRTIRAVVRRVTSPHA
ncbi:MAG: hypothetical protein QOG83_3190, partial [Alphaproteobacteria bacterium]|nr:hypothetical protein [Alphaproteobacteria bacterium]